MSKYSTLAEFFYDQSTAKIKANIEKFSEPDLYSDTIAEIKLRLDINNSPDIFPKIKLPKNIYDHIFFFLKQIQEPAVIFQSQSDEKLLEKFFHDIETDLNFIIEHTKLIDKDFSLLFERLKDFYQRNLMEWQQADDNDKRKLLATTPARIYCENMGARIIPQQLALAMACRDPETGEIKKENESGKTPVAFIGAPGSKVVCKIKHELHQLGAGKQKLAQIYYEEHGSDYVVPTTVAKLEFYWNDKRVSQLIQITEAVEDGVPFSYISQLTELFKLAVKLIDEKKLKETLPLILYENYYANFLKKYELTEEQVEKLQSNEIFSFLQKVITDHPESGIEQFNSTKSEQDLLIQYEATRAQIKSNKDFLKLVALLEIFPELGATQYDLLEAIAMPKRLELIDKFFPNRDLDSIIKRVPHLAETIGDHESISRSVLPSHAVVHEDAKADNILARGFKFDQNNEVKSCEFICVDADSILDEPIKAVYSSAEGANKHYMQQKDVMLLLNQDQAVAPKVVEDCKSRSIEQTHLNILVRVEQFNQRIRTLYFLNYFSLREDAFNEADLDIEIANLREDEKDVVVNQFKYNGVYNDLIIFQQLRERFAIAALDCPLLHLSLNNAFERDHKIQQALIQNPTLTLQELHRQVNLITAFFYEQLVKQYGSIDAVSRKLYGRNAAITDLVRLDNKNTPELTLVYASLEQIVPADDSQTINLPLVNDFIVNYIQDQSISKFIEKIPDEYLYELLNIWSKAFPFLQAIPISQDRLKKLFFIALQNENQIVMSLLLNCYVPVECRHSESKKTALNEALSNHKVNSVLFLIAQGAGEEFDFQLMFEFFQTNLMQKESRVTFEQALKQLCHNNFKFFSYYLRQKFLIETTEDEFDVIDPFTNKKFKIKDEQRDFLTEKLKIKSFTVDGLEVEVEPSPKNLFFSRTMQHHAETFFSANLVQPEETLIFKTDKNLSAFSFRFQFKFISLDQIADRNDKLNLVSLTELTALALCFQGDYFDYYHVVLIERSNGNCDFVVRCHHISEIFLSQRLTENILFTLDAVEKNIPQDFFSLKKKQSLSNLEQWFAFFEDTQNNFDSFIAFCQTNKIDPQPIINNVSRKLLLDSENEKVILEFLYRLRLFVDSRQMHTTVVELIERLNPEIAKKVKDNIEEIPNQAVRIQNSKTNFRVPQQHQENQKRTSIFLSTGTKAIFQAFLKDRDEIQNIISDLGNGNFVSFEKLSSISLKQEILEKINLSTLSKRKVLDLFLKRINESFSEYEKKTEKLKNKLDKLRKKNASPQEINAVKQQIKENINPYEAITFIETLSFEGCEKISFSQIKNILEKTKRLTTLNLSGLNLTEKEIDELVRIALVNNTGLKKLVLNNLKNLTVISIATIKADGEKIKYTVKPKLIEVSLNDCSNLTRITMVCAQLEIFSFLKAPVAELVLLDQQITRLDFTTDIAKFHKSAKRSSTLLLQSPQLLNNYKDNNPEIPSVGISSETILNTAASFELLEHRNLSRLMPSEKATWQLRKLILSTEQVGFVVKANVDKFKSNEESRAKRLTLANTSTSKKKGEFSLNVNFFGSQLSVFERLIFNFKYQLNKREFAVYDFTSITEERKFPEIQEVKQFLQNIDDDFFVLTAKEISYFENAAQYKKSISCIKQNGIFSFGILSNGYLVTAEYTGTTDKTKDNTLLRVWDNVSGACLQDITESHKSLKIHVAGENQVVSVHENHVNIWNIFEAKQITSQRFDNEKIQSSHLLFSFSLLALGMNNGTVNLMTLTKGHKIRQFQAFSAKASLNITAIESLQNGCLALGNSNGEIAVLNTVTKQVTPSFAIKGQVNKITSLKFLEGNCLISGNSSGTVNLWDMEKGIVLKSFSFKDIDCILGFDFFSSNQVLCIGVKGIRSLTISETKLSFELIIKYLEKITIKVDHDEVKILISLTVGPDYKKLEADIRKFLTLVFPDLKEGDSNNKYLIYHAKPEQVRAFEQTLKGCGFEQQIQRKERPEALLATRARLNTLLGGNADNKPSAPTTWRTYNNQSANKRLSFIDGGKHRKSTHFDSAPVVIQEVGQNCNNNNQFGNA